MITFAPILNSSNNEKTDIHTYINHYRFILFTRIMVKQNKTIVINIGVYMKQSMQTIQQLLSLSIAKESSLRNYSLPQNPKNPRIIYRHANQITEEERKQLKGDTINLNSLVSRNISNNMAEAILQLQQDGLIKKKSFIQLTKLDSIFRQELNTANINISHQILLYDKDTIVKQSIGALPTNDLFIKKTQLYPIGTKGLQFIQVKANVPFSSFIQEMLQILIESILLTIIILGYVIFLVITIHKKDKLFKRREASVNGTIHDLKSPLNSIITLMSFIKKKVPDIHTQQLVENTERQAQKLVNEIEALLITARKDRQKVYLQKEETDLVLLVTEVAQEVSMQHSHQPHQIKMESELNELNLMLDPLYVRNVIRNLVENALKYSDDGVQIIIRISKKETQAIFTVKDNGWGIAPKYQKKIFTQFFQVPREQMAHQRGYGIGLAYTKYIIEAHGGSISVESIPGKGSIFICKFPLPS